MKRLATEIWVCQANIGRFRQLLQQTQDAERRRLLTKLLVQQEENLRQLLLQQPRPRKSDPLNPADTPDESGQ